MRREKLIPLVILIGAVLLRGAFLEYSDLFDPTEARYASVAQEMVLLGDWLTPRLPMPDGVVPYMGKPPFHFWLTAGAYSLFGVDEWTARLPSLLSSIAILFVIMNFGRRFFGKQVGLSAALIAFSSVLLFLMSGASVTDVTLTALTSGSAYFLYLFANSDGTQKKFGFFSAALMALAFLTKGPIAVVLVWLPLILWSAFRRDFRWLKAIPWILCSGIFFVITVPWFIANEIHTPGSLRYFFWNENVARYLFKEYGDKYGSGHFHTYGFSWLMLFAAFLPWSPIVAWVTYKSGLRKLKARFKTDKHLLFAFTWGMSAALFFTFVRQLHIMYILPCIPGLALFSAALLDGTKEERFPHLFDFFQRRMFTPILALVGIAIVVIGAKLEFSGIALVLGILFIVSGILYFRIVRPNQTHFSGVQRMSSAFFLIYLLIIVSFTPFLDQHHSTAELLGDLADATVHETQIPRVGVFTKGDFSLYWTSKAWRNELCRELDVEYTAPKKIPKGIKYIILQEKDVAKLSERERTAFHFTRQRGVWQLFSRNQKLKT